MNIQSVSNTPVYSRSVSTESSRGKYSMAEMMAKEMAAGSANIQETAVVKQRLSRGEIDEIADKLYTKYDPHFMLSDEYSSFINDLIDNGALTREESFAIGSLVPVDRGMVWFKASNSPVGSPWHSLIDAKGDPMLHLNARKKVFARADERARNYETNTVNKALAVLEAIEKRREQEGYHSTELLDRHFGIGNSEKREQLAKAIQALKAELFSCYEKLKWNDGETHLSTEIEDMMYSILDRTRPKDSTAKKSYQYS